MFFKNLPFYFFFIFICSCRPTVDIDQIALIKKEISTLKTDEQKRLFLENLLAADQGDRKENIEESDAIMYKNDLYRIEQIGAYFKTYGYPDKAILGNDAAFAPYMVIHHAPSNKTRHKYFPYLYDGYKNGNLSPESFAFFLGRFQRYENGSWIDFNRPFTVEEEIDTLLKALKIDYSKFNSPNS